LAAVHSELGAYAKQIELLERARSINATTFGADHPVTANVDIQLATTNPDYHRSFELTQAAYNTLVEHFGVDHPETATALAHLGKANGRLGRLAL
jgi:hypothetical protein